MIARRSLLMGALVVACTRAAPRGRGGVRVVSLSPSTTETVAALGALSSLVGRSRFCDFPAEVRALPDVGGYVDPNLEAIVALGPSLVLGARGPAGRAIADALTARGIDAYFPPADSLADIDAMIAGVGARLKRDAEARALIERMRAQRLRVVARVSAAPSVRALMLFGLQPIVAAGRSTFAGELLELAGATNVVIAEGYPALDLEAVDPDVIVDAAAADSHGAEPIARDAPGWRELRAVKLGRVIDVSDEAVLRPGPRVVDGLETLARALHPAVDAAR